MEFEKGMLMQEVGSMALGRSAPVDFPGTALLPAAFIAGDEYLWLFQVSHLSRFEAKSKHCIISSANILISTQKALCDAYGDWMPRSSSTKVCCPASERAVHRGFLSYMSHLA
uniref:uncharacterized protein LOC128931568 n=1 Tax=Callithrix jacchus TaxID=9483 RepID=UPI0023DD141D|nr:uncharacterized protein LOC128931568 [Callithrix jacchus]